MQPTKDMSIFDVITDFFGAHPTDEEILAWRLPHELELRAIELLERNGEDELNADERQEMFDFVRVNQMMSLLQAKTQLKGVKEVL
jgi:hypothetical protein